MAPARLRGANGRRHDVNFEGVSVTVEIAFEAPEELTSSDKQRLALLNVPRALFNKAPGRAAGAGKERANLAGLDEGVTFNLDTGFGVRRVQARGQCDLITGVSHAAITAGEFIEASGRWLGCTPGVQCRRDVVCPQGIRSPRPGC